MCWRLKELTPLPMWAGSAVDYIISKALDEIRKGEPCPTGLAEFGARHFRKGLAESPAIVDVMRLRARTYRERKSRPFSPLHHHYYKLDLGKAYEDSLEQRVGTCLTNFENSEVFARIKAVNPEDWGAVVKLDNDVAPSFELKGNKVYSSYDFWFRDGQDVHIIDWKTGSEGFGSASAERQLRVYALYGIYNLRTPLDKIHTQAVWLQGDADWNPQKPTKDDLRVVRDGILTEISSELDLIEVKQFKTRTEYRADREKFPPKPEVRRCTQCKFREICPEGSEMCGHIG